MIIQGKLRSQSRRGVASLIEVLASISVTAVMLGTSATLMTLLFRLDQRGRDDLNATLSEGRLATDLQRDIRSATDLELDPEPPEGGLKLIGPENQIVSYQFQDGILHRRKVVADESKHIESYRLQPGTSARWEAIDSMANRRLRLVLDTPRLRSASAAGRRVMQIEATLGRDHRYQGDEE